MFEPLNQFLVYITEALTECNIKKGYSIMLKLAIFKQVSPFRITIGIKGYIN